MDKASKTQFLTADSLRELDVLMTSDGKTNNLKTHTEHNRTTGDTADNPDTNTTNNGYLIGNAAAEQHFHSHFQVHSNVLSRTKETLEGYLVKRIQQLNSNRRAKSTSKQSDYVQGYLMSSLDEKNANVLNISMMSSTQRRGESLMLAQSYNTNAGGKQRYNSNSRAVPSRVAKRNEELRMLSLMQRSKKLQQHVHQPIEWANQKHKLGVNETSMLPKIDMHDSTVKDPNQ